MWRLKITEIELLALDVLYENRRTSRGWFLAPSSEGKWVAVDNSTGDAWTEKFDDKETAISWLKGEFEV